MGKEEIIDLWLECFKNSNIIVKVFFKNNIRFLCMLAKDKSECSQGYIDNDPLKYTFVIEENNYFEYYPPMIFIKPISNMYAYSHVKLRRKNIKNITKEKLKKRFLEVKKIIIDNKDNFIHLQFNINDKI